MKYTFFAEISVEVEITQEELLHICKACETHYDHKVRSLVEPEGFLYGIKGRREWILSQGRNLLPERLTFRQIDIMSKALEIPLSPEFLKKSFAITLEFRQILERINEKYVQVNNWLQNGITREELAEFKQNKD